MASDINSRIDGVLEKLQYLHSVIKNLKMRDSVKASQLGKIDTRLFSEIAEYELKTEELKMDMLALLMKDARQIAKACVENPNLLARSNEELDQLEEILEFIQKHEDIDIRKSEELQDKAREELSELRKLRKSMKSQVREKSSRRKTLRDTISMHGKFK